MELKDMILRLKEIKEARQRLDEEERLLSTPILSNINDVPDIYAFCDEAYSGMHPEHRRDDPIVRRKYLFIILFLFSPKTIAGGKMSGGLRIKIAEVMGMEASNVSHYHSDLWFSFMVYEDFRNDVNALFKIVFDKLRAKN